ncbi:MAG: amidohydrolase [Bacteroidetes bacterium]|nr:MAG: amidohydrolase [Bacteroidota bacterium]
MKKYIFLALFVVFGENMMAQSKLRSQIDVLADKGEAQVIAWRRDFHQFPELSNREFKTAEKIANHLRKLGLEVQTGIANTGVVGILKGDKAGPVVALRADIDALPLVERVPVAFASKEKAVYNGQEVGVMHACGHDSHTAMLLGAAEVLVSLKKDLKGTVKFIFQPCEEGAPEGEEGGAKLMIEQGVLKNPNAEVIFGLHINSGIEVGQIKYKPQGIMAAADRFQIKVNGKGTHGSTPWTGIDPIVAAAQIINGIQTIVSRQVALTDDPAVVTVGAINGGVRNNIIPEEVSMIGTIRTFNEAMQQKIHEKLVLTAQKIAESMGASAEVKITRQYPVTYNHEQLTADMLPTLQAAAGKENVSLTKAWTGAEDFSFYQKQIPGLFFFLGGMAKGTDSNLAAPHHTPDFKLDESGFKLGVKTLCYLTVDYMERKAK